MLTRRTTLALLAAGLATPALARDNPMPEPLRKALERDPNAPVLGNPNGDVTLTQFFDYNCPHCRRIAPLIPTLIAAEPKLRIVYREWPVFGEGSTMAARVALGALAQGRYWPVHAGIMGRRGEANEAVALEVAKAAGLDMARLATDMAAPRVSDHIATSQELADHMSLVGTPTFIAGDEGVFGYQSLDDLRALVARARKTLG